MNYVLLLKQHPFRANYCMIIAFNSNNSFFFLRPVCATDRHTPAPLTCKVHPVKQEKKLVNTRKTTFSSYLVAKFPSNLPLHRQETADNTSRT